MKPYNPFKPHFCQFGDGSFGMRKLSFYQLGWAYLDTNDMRYWRESKYGGSRHADLSALKTLVAHLKASRQRAKDAKKSRRVS